MCDIHVASYILTTPLSKDSRGCRAWTIEKKTGEKLVGPLITLKMAREEKWASNNKKWENMPDVMLSYRAASFFSRAYCPDLTGGFHSSDELSDSQDDFKADVPTMSTEATTIEEAKVIDSSSQTSLDALKEEILA